MNPKLRRAVLIVLINVNLLLVLLEGGLRLFDPWRVVAYYNDLSILYRHYQEDARRDYLLAPGSYQFSNWQVLMLPDGTRYVPATNENANCTVAILGDSVTFGYGVSDGTTWVSLMAAQLPDVRLLNTGIPGYNVDNVLRTRLAIHADAYIYLLIGNDNDMALPWQSYQTLEGSAIAKYLYVARARTEGIPSGAKDSLSPAFDVLLVDSLVTTVGFEDDLTNRIKDRYPTLRLIPRFTTTNSRVDSHPDIRGNVKIATSILPVVREAVQKHCTYYKESRHESDRHSEATST